MSFELDGADVPLVLAALEVAAEAKRNAADECQDCDGYPDGDLCATCAWRLTAADEWDELREGIEATR